MSTPQKAKLSPDERESRLGSVIDNSCQRMEDAGIFVLAVGKLLEAFSNDEIDGDVMSELVIGGLAAGLMMTGVALQTEVEVSRKRVEVEINGGAQ